MVRCVVGCSRSNSTKSPASGTGKESKPNLMSQVRNVRIDQCFSAIIVVEVPVSSAYVAAAIVTEVGGL
jgi:hypothetical protein